MSLQWQIAAGFLYTEMALVVIMLLPFISPKKWNYLFKSRLVKSMGAYYNFYSKVIVCMFLILLADAARQVYKYSALHDSERVIVKGAEDHIHMELFRAQRNLYISGFALFLWLVLCRLVGLISGHAQLLAESEASLKQAKNASETAEKLLAQGNKANASGDADKAKKELEMARGELDKANQELKRTQQDLDTMKKQSTQNNKEYDNLMKEHEKLQKRLTELESSGESKKST